jgi:hypothetical protein
LNFKLHLAGSIVDPANEHFRKAAESKIAKLPPTFRVAEKGNIHLPQDIEHAANDTNSPSSATSACNWSWSRWHSNA